MEVKWFQNGEYCQQIISSIFLPVNINTATDSTKKTDAKRQTLNVI